MKKIASNCFFVSLPLTFDSFKAIDDKAKGALVLNL